MDEKNELYQIVKDDLDYLQNEWHQDITESSIRISSSILRRLLIESHLNQVANHFKLKLRVLVSESHKSLENKNVSEINFWQSGGGNSYGVVVEDITLIKKSMSNKEFRELHETTRKNSGKYPIKLSKFLKLPSYVIRGEIINKEEVIKYVCNKIGGVHFDDKRNKNKLERKYELLDDIQKNYEVANRTTIYYELISIGQSLNKSKDIIKLKKKLKSIL